MAVTYASAVKTARITASRDYHANGTLEILDGSSNVLATFGLSASSGTIAGDVWTLAFDAGTVNASAAGTAAAARIKNSAGTVGISGLTVGTSGTDVVLNNTNIASGQAITLDSATITHA